MDLGDCYRLLGLRSGASFADIKASYRRLAQQYHPDINPNDIRAKDKFIALTEAYKLLLTVVPSEEIAQPSSNSSQFRRSDTQSTRSEKAPTTTVTAEKPPTSKPPNLLEIEQRLKWKTYEQLQRFLKERRFPQAIALAEALAARLPTDAEVRQWQ
ncbi:MAG: J domain-containing protein, partial [Nodularia sp. (in: Bacteria)]